MTQSNSLGPPSLGELVAKITTSPEGRLRFTMMSWFLIGGGILLLIVGLASPTHPNPYLLSLLMVMGVESVVAGAGILLYLRQSRLASWVMLLGCLLFLGVLYLLVRVFTYVA
jgi:uncharacterized membrane protein HdeD (DUF308 family)